MSSPEFSPVIFDNSSERDRNVTSRDLRRLALWALTATSRERRLHRINKGKTVAWTSIKPDFEHYERASFSVTHTNDVMDYWRLNYRYLSQKYPEQDEMQQFEDEFGNNADPAKGWGKGELTTYSAYWSEDDPIFVKREIMDVPSYTKQEAARLDDILFTGRADVEVIGEKDHDKLHQIRDLEITDKLESQNLWVSDLKMMQSTIHRLNKTKAHRLRK